jgi:hypothetical protein
LLAALAGLSARADLLGVTSIVRTMGLAAHCYDRLLDFGTCQKFCVRGGFQFFGLVNRSPYNTAN